MIPVKFKEANRILGKPESIDVEPVRIRGRYAMRFLLEAQLYRAA